MRAILLALFFALVLVGCANPTIRYNGEYRPLIEVEEMLADTLEAENPNLDLEVQITQDED